MKKVLIISSSPRKNSNSEALCKAFAEGAVEAGKEAEIVALRDKTINFCRVLTQHGTYLDTGATHHVTHTPENVDSSGTTNSGINSLLVGDGAAIIK